MATHTVTYLAVVRRPGCLAERQRQEATFDTATPVLEVVRELGRLGAVYSEPDELFELAQAYQAAGGGGGAFVDYGDITAAAQLGAIDRVNARRAAAIRPKGTT